MRATMIILATLIPGMAIAEPSTRVCVGGSYMVFFDPSSSALTPQAKSILDKAAAAYKNCGRATVIMSGHTDRFGSDEANSKLSGEMALSTAEYLVGHGIAADRFAISALGETEPLVKTLDGVAEPMNRRVEFVFRFLPANP